MSFLKLESKYFFKIILFGNPSVGKTTLIRRLETHKFKSNLPKTIGVNFANVTHIIKEYYIDNIPISILIWDFSGEDRFLPYFRMWLRGTTGGIFLFDITNKSSFDSFDYWWNIIRSEINYDFPLYFVGSKLDLSENRKVSTSMIKQKIDNIYPYFECSSKSGENVEKIFEKISIEIFTLRKKFKSII